MAVINAYSINTCDLNACIIIKKTKLYHIEINTIKKLYGKEQNIHSNIYFDNRMISAILNLEVKIDLIKLTPVI
jgi:hypothetical protein